MAHHSERVSGWPNVVALPAGENMTLRRAALYTGGATLLVAWFSSAASISLSRGSPSAALDTGPAASPIEHLAENVQQQSRRLRERLSSPPSVPQPRRNPFAFHVEARPVEAVRRVPRIASPPAPIEPQEPSLTLIGVAEQHRPQGLVRTAMIATAGDELIIAAIGDGLLQRYRVTAVSVDAVELVDETTGRTRRLSLQFY